MSGQTRIHLGDHLIERCRIAFNLRFKLQTFANTHDRHPMIAKRSADNHGIARSGSVRRDVDSVRNDADSRRVDITAVTVAAFDDFRIAGDDRDAGRAGGCPHVVGDLFQLGDRKAFFDDESGAQIERASHRSSTDH